jgi:hypothetical protein
MRTLALMLVSLAACHDTAQQLPDAAVRIDAPRPVDAPHPDAPRLPYGSHCTDASQCTSGLCVGTPGVCSRSCSLAVANDCKDVNAFCAPLTSGGNACYGMIVTGSDPDDAILQTGDTVMRVLSPLADADLFLVNLDMLGTTVITATPQAGIDVQLEGYDAIGEALGVANAGGPSVAESLQTNVVELGHHIFVVARDVGTSTGTYTLAVTHMAAAAVATPHLRIDEVPVLSATE